MESKVYFYKDRDGVQAQFKKMATLEPHFELTYNQLKAITKGLKKEYKRRKKFSNVSRPTEEEIYHLNIQLQEAFNSDFDQGM